MEESKEQKQIVFYKKAAMNLTESNFKLQATIEDFKYFIEAQKNICSLAITACGTDEKSAFIYKKYRQLFENKLKELDIEKILLA